MIKSDTRSHSLDVLDDDKGDSRFRFICALSKNWKPKKCRKHSLLLRDSFRAHSWHRFIYNVFVARNWSYWGLDNTSLSWYIPPSLFVSPGHMAAHTCWMRPIIILSLIFLARAAFGVNDPHQRTINSWESWAGTTGGQQPGLSNGLIFSFPSNPVRAPEATQHDNTQSVLWYIYTERCALRNAADSTVWLKETYFPINSCSTIIKLIRIGSSEMADEMMEVKTCELRNIALKFSLFVMASFISNKPVT